MWTRYQTFTSSLRSSATTKCLRKTWCMKCSRWMRVRSWVKFCTTACNGSIGIIRTGSRSILLKSQSWFSLRSCWVKFCQTSTTKKTRWRSQQAYISTSVRGGLLWATMSSLHSAIGKSLETWLMGISIDPATLSKFWPPCCSNSNGESSVSISGKPWSPRASSSTANS